MTSVMKIAKEENTSKHIVLRAAINLGFYDPIRDKKNLFDTSEKAKIKKEVRRIRQTKKIGNKINLNNFISKKPSNNYVDISGEWTFDINLKDLKYKYNAIDLFSGAGGVALGIINAGFKPILNAEIFDEALETYNRNLSDVTGIVHKKTSVEDVEGIIKNINKKSIDLIFGGFPCQGFSVSGIRSNEDPRNKLFEYMFDIVKKIKPKVVVMENVLGILSAKIDKSDKLLINHIIELYNSIGYEIDYKILNAADYGAPQLRKRVIIMANRIGKNNLFPMPILQSDMYITAKDALKKYENIANTNYDNNFILTNHKKQTLEKMKTLKSGECLYSSFSDSWKRLYSEKPAWTIKENHGGVNIHYSQNRVLTPREMAALQTFPDDFIFCGSKAKQLVQIGNAVPPILAKAIGIAIIKMLES